MVATLPPGTYSIQITASELDTCIRQHTSAYVSIRQHTSAYVSIRQYLFGRDVFDNIGVLELLEQQFLSVIRVRDMFAFV
jgi:hypothetical protein